MRLSRLFKSFENSPAVRLLLWGYGSYILTTWVLLCLPWAWEAGRVGFLDNLFIAASAISTTGLATVDTPKAYSFFGEFVILAAIQMGGLGYMTLGSFVVLERQKDISEFRERLGQTVLGLPEDFNYRRFLREMIYFTLAVEILGALWLHWAFKRAGVPGSLWQAVFHSVSAFCTAGFSLFSNSLEGFRGDFWVNLIVSVESFLGAAGFIVMSDAWNSARDPRRTLTVTSRVILRVMTFCILGGWLFFFLQEPTLRGLGFLERLMASGFQSMTAMTTVGFDTHPIGSFHAAGILIFLILMIIGAAPAGTGGGLKATTVGIVYGVMKAVIQGRKEVVFAQRRIPDYRIFQAFAALGFYLAVYLIGTTALLALESHAFGDLLFESASALGTVGLSRGITFGLTSGGKWVLIVMMFLGRVGPLSFGLALLSRQSGQKKHADELEEDFAV